MITVTEAARRKVLELMKSEPREGLSLRFGVNGRGPGGFLYRLAFVEPADRSANDRVQALEGFEVVIDEASLPSVSGATIDFLDGPNGSGFKIENPNPLWADPHAVAVQQVLDEEINPAVATHGGFVTLLDVREGVAYIQMGGGCQGCGMVDVTLKQGIEVRIRERVPAIQGIVDSTDHAGGTNPYYRPSKGGGPSPVAG